MKDNTYKYLKAPLSSMLVAFVAMVIFSADIAVAEDDMMGSMPPAQQQSGSKPMQGDPSNSSDTTDVDHDHEMMKADHEEMKKDHKNMKKDAKASMEIKHQNMKKMGKKKDKPMQMKNSDPGMMNDNSMPPADKPKDPSMSDGMGHM